MDYFKKNPSSDKHFPNTKTSPSDPSRKNCTCKEITAKETNENEGQSHKGFAVRSQNPSKDHSKNFMPTMEVLKKKILAERNDGRQPDSSNTLFFEKTPNSVDLGSGRLDAPYSQITPFSSRVHESGDQSVLGSDSSHSGAYDPLTNYLSPRPEFLRYNPNRRKEIFLRREGDARKEEGSGIDWRLSSDLNDLTSEESPTDSSASSSKSPFQDEEIQESEDDEDAEDDMEVDKKEERPWYSSKVLKLLLLLGVLFFTSYYISSIKSASVPSSLQQYGGFKETFQKIKDPHPQSMGNPSMDPRNFLEVLMGSSETCLNVHLRELTSGDDLVEKAYSKEGESHDEILNVRLGELMIGDERVSSNFSIWDDLTEVVDPKAESHDGIEVVTETDGDILVEKEILTSNDFIVEGMIEETFGGRNTPIVTVEGSGKEETGTAETGIISHHMSEFLQVPQAQSVLEYSSIHHDAEIYILTREEKLGEEFANISESLSYQPQFISDMLSDHQNTEASAVPGVSEMRNLGNKAVYVFVLKLLVPVLIILSAVVYFALYKYRRGSHENSLPTSPTSSEAAVEEKPSLPFPVQEEMEDGGTNSNVNLLPLKNSDEEQKQFNGTRPPTVELLGEFSIVGASVSETSFDLKSKKASGEDSQFSQSQRRARSMRNSPSLSANKVYLSPSEFMADVSTSYGSFTAQEKLQGMEDGGDRKEVVNVVATPIRRSSRLRNRVTSP